MILNLTSSQVSFILDETMSFVMDICVNKKAASVSKKLLTHSVSISDFPFIFNKNYEKFVRNLDILEWSQPLQ